MFTPSNMLMNYLFAQPREIYDIVGALMGYINADPYFKTNEFEEAIKYVLNNGVSEDELFQPFDEQIDFETDSSKWDEDYYFYARVYLKDNFCRERIKHIKAVAHKLHPLSQQRSASATNCKGGQQKSGKKSQDHQRSKKKTIPKSAGKSQSGVNIGAVVIHVMILMVVIVFIISRIV
jgi:hypothetical protein